MNGVVIERGHREDGDALRHLTQAGLAVLVWASASGVVIGALFLRHMAEVYAACGFVFWTVDAFGMPSCGRPR